MTKEQHILFELLQVAFGLRKELSLSPTDKEWDEVYSLAESQNVVCVVFEGIGHLPKHQRTYMDLLMDWLGQTDYLKAQYEEQKKAIVELASIYKLHGIQMLLLKGYGLSLNYPTSSLRPCGDIDVFLYGKHEDADRLMENSGIIVKRDNRHHSTFSFRGFTVENHRTMIDQDNHKSNVRLEKVFQELIDKNSGIAIDDNLFIPSPTLNAIYLLRHAGEHFTSSEITMRHVLDIGTLFQNHSAEIDWEKVLSVYEDERMKSFYNVIATICTRDLGFKKSSFRGFQSAPELADRVLEDIFTKKDTLPMSTTGIIGLAKLKYGVQKSIRWYRNRWKYQMVYKETLCESFLTLALNRIKN